MFTAIGTFFDSLVKLINMFNRAVNSCDNVIAVAELHSANFLTREGITASAETEALRARIKAGNLPVPVESTSTT